MLRHPRSPVFLFCKWDISSQKAQYLHYHACRYLEICRSQMARKWLIVRSTIRVNVFPDHLKFKITWSRTTASPREKSAETCLTICSHQAGDWNLCKIMTVQRSMMTGGRIVGSAAEDWDDKEKTGMIRSLPWVLMITRIPRWRCWRIILRILFVRSDEPPLVIERYWRDVSRQANLVRNYQLYAPHQWQELCQHQDLCV